MIRILLLATAFNSLTQRVLTELRDRGHPVAVELAVRGEDDRLVAAVGRHAPGLVVAPMLTSAIPERVWRSVTCLVVHPGPPGDRGPSALDRAVQDGVARWGVTVLEAVAEMDAGPVWASAGFAVPPGVAKSDLYRGELADAAVEAVLAAVRRFASGRWVPRPPAASVWRPYLRQEERRIDWSADSMEAVLGKLRAADSRPGVLDTFLGAEWYLHGGHPEERLTGPPGEALATCAGAVCRATADGAVWIPQLRRRRVPGGPPTFRLPAVMALGPLLPALPELPAGPGPLLVPGETAPGPTGDRSAGNSPASDKSTATGPTGPTEHRAWSGIRYEEHGRTGFLRFSFPGGAMGAAVCRRLLAAYRLARSRPVDVLVLGGERDFFSNGIDLNLIEAAADPAAESLASIEAIDDLVAEILTTTDRLVVSAIAGNAAAGGVMLALAADEVWCRSGSVLNPHYRLMGLYGSEYWTYTLPRKVGRQAAERLTEGAQPIGAAAARSLGLVDRVLECAPGDFTGEVARAAERLAHSGRLSERLGAKKAARDRDERRRPLSTYRQAELARMRAVFDDPAAPYHALRSAFVHKRRPDGTARPLMAETPGDA